MIAYKLVRQRKDGTLAPLFINRTETFPIGVGMIAKCYPTKGFAIRKGFHCTFEKYAPHLSTKNRVWVKVEVFDWEDYDRPESQGGKWILANWMKILEVCDGQ